MSRRTSDHFRSHTALPVGVARTVPPRPGCPRGRTLSGEAFAAPGFVGEFRVSAGGDGVGRFRPPQLDDAAPRRAGEAGPDGPPGRPASRSQRGRGPVVEHRAPGVGRCRRRDVLRDLSRA